MSVNFKSIARKNPRDLAATPKYYALAMSKGVTDIDRLSAQISDGSTVRQADVYAVIISLVNAIQGELREGRTVRLGKLGSFSLTLSSNGIETEEEVGASLIKNVKIRYRPGSELKDMLKTLKFNKI